MSGGDELSDATDVSNDYRQRSFFFSSFLFFSFFFFFFPQPVASCLGRKQKQSPRRIRMSDRRGREGGGLPQRRVATGTSVTFPGFVPVRHALPPPPPVSPVRLLAAERFVALCESPGRRPHFL